MSTVGPDPTLFVHDVRGRSDDAQVDGYLRYLHDVDCFVLDSTTIRHVAVWPPGTKAWRDGAEVAGVEVRTATPSRSAAA